MHQTSTHDHRPAGGEELPDGPVLVAGVKDIRGVHIPSPWTVYPNDPGEVAVRQIADETGETAATVRDLRNAMDACDDEAVIEARAEHDDTRPGGFFRELVHAVLRAAPPRSRPVGPVAAAGTIARDEYVTELLTRFLCQRQGVEYVTQGAGGAPQYSQVEGIRGAARGFLWDMHAALISRATRPCVFVDGDPDAPVVCHELRADDGRSLYCPAHAARVNSGDRGLSIARETIIAEQTSNETRQGGDQ